MSHLKRIMTRESTINMLPSKGKPNLGAAAKLMVPVILEAIYNIDNEKKAGERDQTKVDERPITTAPGD